MPSDRSRRPRDPSAIRRRLFGLEPDAVQRLFERQRAGHAELERQLDELRARFEQQRVELDDLREHERLITGAIGTAQRAADEIVAAAEEEAQRRLEAADAEVAHRLDRAEQPVEALATLASSFGDELVEHATVVRDRLTQARAQLVAAPEPSPPPATPPPGAPEAAAPPRAAPAAPVTVPLEDLPPQGRRTVRVVLEPIGTPADLATAERRMHDLAGVHTVRLEDLSRERATLLVGVDVDEFDVVPLLDSGAELVSADRDLVELRVPRPWNRATQPGS